MTCEEIESELKALHDKLDHVLELVGSGRPAKEFYTTEEVARLVGRDPFTVREWARLGRIHATKRDVGRGKYPRWSVSRAELERIRNHGILPLRRATT